MQQNEVRYSYERREGMAQDYDRDRMHERALMGLIPHKTFDAAVDNHIR